MTKPLSKKETPLALASARRQRYELEKQTGRRSPSGVLRLRRLKPRHRKVIGMHLAGVPSRDIAKAMGTTDSAVSIILSDPLAQEVIEKARASWEMEFDALYGKHLDSLRSGFNSGDVRDKLRASSIYSRERTERVRTDPNAAGDSAEDVIQRMLQLNIQVNVAGEKSG